MVVSRTPYRVSFSGGGTDLPAFYRQEWGAVLSATIAQYITVSIKRSDRWWRLKIGSTEERVGEWHQVRHDIVRECLALFPNLKPVEITIESDLPIGCGMGGSGALTVGLLNAICWFDKFDAVEPARLAEQACEIEISTLHKPIGKQDAYAAAFGGLNYFRFNPDESVTQAGVADFELDSMDTINELESHCLLFYTGATRHAEAILREQSARTYHHLMGSLRRMRDIASEMLAALDEGDGIERFGQLLDETWQLKRSMGCGISTPHIDDWYGEAIRAGAWGGKLCGAGGNGFVLFVAPPDRHEEIRAALGRPMELLELPFRISWEGSEIISQPEMNLANFA